MHGQPTKTSHSIDDFYLYTHDAFVREFSTGNWTITTFVWLYAVHTNTIVYDVLVSLIFSCFIDNYAPMIEYFYIHDFYTDRAIVGSTIVAA